MKDKSKSYFVVLAAAALILFLILVPSAASAAPAHDYRNPDHHQWKFVQR